MKDKTAEMALLAMSMMTGGMNPEEMIEAEARRLVRDKQRRDNPHNYPMFTFQHGDREFKIYAYNEAAANDKWEAIKKKLR